MVWLVLVAVGQHRDEQPFQPSASRSHNIGATGQGLPYPDGLGSTLCSQRENCRKALRTLRRSVKADSDTRASRSEKDRVKN